MGWMRHEARAVTKALAPSTPRAHLYSLSYRSSIKGVWTVHPLLTF